MVTDKVVDHFQPVEEEKEPYLVQNFLVLDSGEVSLLRFLSYFFKLATPLTASPTPVKVAKTAGF